METFLVGKVPYQIFTSVKHRISFIYFEYGRVVKENNSLLFIQADRQYDIPVGKTLAVLLGPGTSITQPAIMECSRWGCTVNFVSQNGTNLYSSYLSGGPSQAYNQIRQAQIVSSPKLRLTVARKMYAKRWGENNVPKQYTIAQLMRLEGSRMRRVYETQFKRTNLPRVSRVSKIDFLKNNEDDLNKTLTAGNSMLYGLVNSVIISLGLSTALGVIHNGNIKAFTFDIADLYKESFMIPLVFDIVAEGGGYSDLRKLFRDRLLLLDLIPTIIDDVFDLLDLAEPDEITIDSGIWLGGEDFLSSQEKEEQGRL